MKKLIFLHGAGADKTSYSKLMNEIAQFFGAELISFNAPFPHPTKENKFVWFNKVAQNGRRDAVTADYLASMQYIKAKLQEISSDTKDIILVGHSQGGGMAVHIGLELNLRSVISISADLPYNISYENKSATPIYWFEAGEDGYIDDNRKASYRLLEEIKANLHYQILPHSMHNEFAEELLSAINDCFKQYNCGIYGDSIAFGYSNHNISWFDMLYHQKNAVKLAQNGEKIANVLHKIKHDNNFYKTLIFAVGINDLLQTSPNIKNVSFSDLLAQYEKILLIAKEKANKIIVQSLLPVQEALFPNQDWLDGNMWAHNETIALFNAALALLCQKLAVDFVDFYNVFKEQNLATLYDDAVHLNDKGQKFLKKLYAKI